MVLALLGSFALEWWSEVSLTQQLVLWVAFGTLFPLVFFRYSRALWLSFDHFFDPEDDAMSEGDAHEA